MAGAALRGLRCGLGGADAPCGILPGNANPPACAVSGQEAIFLALACTASAMALIMSLFRMI
jgi:hypothetical protein